MASVLTPSAIQLCEDAVGIQLFEAVGQPIRDNRVVMLSQWDEAMACLLSDEWCDVRLEAKNKITSTLFRADRRVFNQWNEIIDVVNDLVESKVCREAELRLHGSAEQRRLGSIEIVSMIRMAVIEEHFRSTVDGRFFRELYYFLRIGHLPCGQVEPAEGSKRLVVF